MDCLIVKKLLLDIIFKTVLHFIRRKYDFAICIRERTLNSPLIFRTFSNIYDGGFCQNGKRLQFTIIFGNHNYFRNNSFSNSSMFVYWYSQYVTGASPCKFLWEGYVNVRLFVLDNIRILVKALQKQSS